MAVNTGSYTGVDEKIAANTIREVTIYTRFSEYDPLPSDWSFVVWGEKAPVEIIRDDGRESD